MASVRLRPHGRMQSSRRRVINALKRGGILRARQIRSLGVAPETLRRLVAQRVIERVGRGLYMLAGADVSAENSLVQAQARVPQGVICLLSALRFHDLGTQNPQEVWLAVDRKARKPVVDYPPIRLVRFSGPALTNGVREYTVDGQPVKITTPSRTVADCFKYRNKVGLDIALEALREYRRKRAGTADELWEAARLDRVTGVLKPYAEAIT